MNAVLRTARERGWPEEQLHFEFFASDAAAPRQDDGSFNVRLASSGRLIPVLADQSVTQALNAAGVEVMTFCELGVSRGDSDFLLSHWHGAGGAALRRRADSCRDQ